MLHLRRPTNTQTHKWQELLALYGQEAKRVEALDCAAAHYHAADRAPAAASAPAGPGPATASRTGWLRLSLDYAAMGYTQRAAACLLQARRAAAAVSTTSSSANEVSRPPGQLQSHPRSPLQWRVHPIHPSFHHRDAPRPTPWEK